MKYLPILVIMLIISCNTSKNQAKNSADSYGMMQNSFVKNDNINFEIIDCTLSNGDKSKCLKITTKGTPAEHQLGPWCPDNITDDASKGGIWFLNGKTYDVDGEFIKNLPELYSDKNWKLYEDDGTIRKTHTKEDCEQLAGAQLVDKFLNHCIECLPSYVSDIVRTMILPLNPVKIEVPLQLGGGAPGSYYDPTKTAENVASAPRNQREDRPRGERGGPPPKGERGNRPRGKRGGGNIGPTIRGVALSGVAFDGPAPLHIILAGYSIPALDDAGGHVNMDAGYHYHATTGISHHIEQADGHAPLIGYAMDGFGIYAHSAEDGSSPNDLDACRGHYDDIRGYHYHVDESGNNNFINCFHGAIASE
jgi:hypothetical protein